MILIYVGLNPELQNYEVLTHQTKKVIGQSFIHAFSLYKSPTAQILFIKSKIETNIYEQKEIELILLKNNVKSIRRTF
jgi:hypothetical protein